MLAALVAVLASATPGCAREVLHAEVSADLETVRGELRCEGTSDTAVATYPRLLRTPVGVDDLDRPWLYPDGFSAADLALELDGARLAGQGAWQALPPGALTGPGTSLRFTTTVPARNGPFGRRDGTLSLLAGWYPRFGVAGQPLPDTPLDYEVRVPPGTSGFVGVEPFGPASGRVLRGHFVGRFLPVLVAIRGLEARRSAAGVVVRVRPPPGLRELGSGRDGDTLEAVAGALGEAFALAREAGLAPAPLVVLVGAAREHLAWAFDGGLLVSDRAFHVPPLELFARFHRFAIWRAALTAWGVPRAREREAELPPQLAAEAVGVALRDELAVRVLGRSAAWAPELLEPVAVIPEIDNLIFAPQIPLVDAYFDAVEERRPDGPPDPDLFESSRPRGRLLHEKLVAWSSAERARALAHAYLAGHEPWLSLVGREGGAEVAASLRAWIGPVVDLGYGLGPARTAGASVTVEVTATGADAARIVEPVEVELEDAAGGRQVRSRVGPGPVSFPEPAGTGGPRVVALDPGGHLVQTAHAEGVDPGFDDREPPRWRLLLENITGLVAVTNQQLTAAANFSLRRLHDLRYRFDFQGLYSPEAYGLSGAASYGWGSSVTPLRLSDWTGVGVSGERLRVERGVGTPGWEVAATAFHLHDTRPSPFSAYSGEGLSARLTAARGVDRGGTSYGYARASLAALALLPLGSYHALLGRVRADALLGSPPPQQELRLGSRYYAGRGFEPDEARGARRVVASVEDRHALSVDTRTDLGLFLVTGVEGALFADAVYLPDATPSCGHDVYYDAGYGLRFLVDVLGVSPSSVALDVGVPFGRCAAAGKRGPVTIYLAFVQSFLVF